MANASKPNQEPTNHHYVSRCLINNFFDTSNSIYLYDKQLQRYNTKKSSRRIFSESELNSILDHNGKIDHSTIEKGLNKNFETHFPIHYKRINDLVANLNDENIRILSESGELTESLYYFLRMGIIGDMRTPDHKKSSESIILGNFEPILKNATEEIKQAFEEFAQSRKQTKYLNLLDFKEISEGIVKNMGEIFFSILVASAEDFFLLPDCSSVTWRAQLQDDDIIDGVKYHNPTRPIAVVGMPINSRIFILVESKKISRSKFDSIKLIPSDYVFILNKWLYKSANKSVACQNESFLKNFIEKVNQSGQ